MHNLHSDGARFGRQRVYVPDSLTRLHLIDVRSALMRAIHAAHEDHDQLGNDQQLADEIDRLIGELSEHLLILQHLTQTITYPRMRRIRR